ncbi:BspA family leucine-rich repeat surface protein [Leuconostoc falkenbergense]|uniref:BspA family leucine-rich repeat surface protein n=1 Tax=Leuconostoc falkenbergense TaxID=2766470 RepID=UPI001662F715|nr:BspA family leucine-rich repeat surface protein [Leuconostoc falkenbergense]
MPVNSGYMFANLTNLISFDSKNVDTSQVVMMFYMFSSTGITHLDLSNWDVKKVQLFTLMFSGSKQLKSLNLSGWGVGRTANNVNMHGMFSSTNNLTNINLDNFSTTNVTRLDYMFSSSGIISLDLSSWDVTKVSMFGYMFYNTSALTDLNLSNWGVDRTAIDVSMYSMFRNTNKLQNLVLTNFKTTNVINMAYMFCDVGVRTLDLSDWDMSQVEICEYMFSNANRLLKITLGEQVTFTQPPYFSNPEVGAIITDNGQTYKATANRWQSVGSGTDHKPTGELVTGTQMAASTPRPVTYVWAQSATIHAASPLTFGIKGASAFRNEGSPIADNMSSGTVDLINLGDDVNYNVTVAQTSDWTTEGELAKITKSALKLRYGSGDLSVGAINFWSGTSSTSEKSILFNHDTNKNFSVWLNPNTVISSDLLGKQLESELTWTLSETP